VDRRRLPTLPISLPPQPFSRFATLVLAHSIAIAQPNGCRCLEWTAATGFVYVSMYRWIIAVLGEVLDVLRGRFEHRREAALPQDEDHRPSQIYKVETKIIA